MRGRCPVLRGELRSRKARGVETVRSEQPDPSALPQSNRTLPEPVRMEWMEPGIALELSSLGLGLAQRNVCDCKQEREMQRKSAAC